MKKIKHHHRFCRRWPYWFHSPFAGTHPICLCRDHKQLLDSFIGEETGSEGGDAFTKGPHHWFQKSWNLGEEHLWDVGSRQAANPSCAFQKSTKWVYKHLKLWHWEVNTRLGVALTCRIRARGSSFFPRSSMGCSWPTRASFWCVFLPNTSPRLTVHSCQDWLHILQVSWWASGALNSECPPQT